MNKKIILISGKKGAGKTTSSKAIIERFGRDVKIEMFSFAKPLKESCNALIETTFGKEYTKPEHKELVRSVYQAVGIIGRNISDRYWVDKVMTEIMLSDCDVAIIDDTRFPNEFDITKGVDGYDLLKIRLTRKSDIDNGDTDPTEIAMDNVPDSEFDMVVYNMTAEKSTLDNVETFIYGKVGV